MTTPTTTALESDENSVLALAIAQSYLLDIDAANWPSIQGAIEEAYRLGRHHARTRKPRPTRPTAKPATESKKAMVIGLLKRPEGATIAQIRDATGWQTTTVRAFFSIVKSNMGLTITNQRAKGAPTVYFAT
ncbi:MAG: DUF3489 domain-containing protein [Magnetococcales bacterium]|nr:DUF3489 domain-containing protein [Magnetococcales bacterium]